jgi:DNA invertase Pin-like site-specific DNA recombinase
VAASKEKWRSIQALKAQGYSQIQIARELGCSKPTVWRLWNEKSETQG